MEKVVPWAALVERIAPYYPEGKTGRAPFSLGDKAPMWICESTLPRIEEEHRATGHPVCAVELVDGAWQADGGTGMSAPKTRGKALQSVTTAPLCSENDSYWGSCA